MPSRAMPTPLAPALMPLPAAVRPKPNPIRAPNAVPFLDCGTPVQRSIILTPDINATKQARYIITKKKPMGNAEFGYCFKKATPGFLADPRSSKAIKKSRNPIISANIAINEP